MPNDAKLGLIVGVGLVLVVAVVFYRKEPGPNNPGPGDAAPLSVGNTSTGEQREPARTAPVQQTARTKGDGAEADTRKHTVQEGDTLFSLAEQYYSDKSKFTQIYAANGTVIKSPDQLTPGDVLVIPTLPEQAPAAAEADATP